MANARSLPAAALLAGLAAAYPAASLAAEPSCLGRRIEADITVRQRWPDLLERLRGEVVARADVEDCASVELRWDAGMILLTVSLPDGRTATREVLRSEDVWPSLQALLLLPERPEPPPAVVEMRTRPSPTRRASLAPLHPQRDEGQPILPARARELGIELSVLAGSRIGDGQVSMGGGVLSFLELHGWLIGFQGRADGYRPLAGGDPQTTLELAVLGGKRWALGGVALDVTAGPAMAMKGFTVSRTESVYVDRNTASAAPLPPPPPREEPSSGPLPRLLLGARLGFSPRSVFRTFVGVDAEVGLERKEADAVPGPASLPRFSLGLALGGTVGTR
ncbi:MAG: hypothetical protein K0R38_3471 [Polyangiaceae bacterium]|jgi:hypothetical protein|nr:hypothetical protein [Polyangiaceae bacterium]